MFLRKDKFLGAKDNFEEADLVLFGAPMDYTVSFRPGSRFGPQAVRDVSESLEEYSYYQDCDITELNYADAGDLDLPLGNVAKSLEIIEKTTKKLIKEKKIPFLLGGEHLISYPAVKAAAELYPDLVVIHLDAHTDLRPEYGGERFSHASVFRLACDHLKPRHLYQFGIRSGPKEDFAFAREHANLFPEKVFVPLRDVLPKINNKPVYFSMDIDVLDPSVAPGTGTPEPGGCSFTEILSAVFLLAELNVVGLDLVEVAPAYDPSGVTSVVAAKLVREAIIAVLKGKIK